MIDASQSLAAFDWIFFDCFNTLIDDFDPSGDESGMVPIHELAIASGLYATAAEFGEDYLHWRQAQWVNQWQEVVLLERLKALLKRRSPTIFPDQLETLAAGMVEGFATNYPTMLRLPQGVTDMLNHWQGKVRMGVISNFHLANYPQQMLAQFGLTPYFDFVLDSAACGWRKPGPEIYQVACQLARIPDAEIGTVLFVGDHLTNDVLKPLELGMQAIYFDRCGDRPSSSPAPDHVTAITHWDQFR